MNPRNDDESRIPWEELVSKVEYLFSTCTQKVKIKMLTQETLERDQGINRREKRDSRYIEVEGAAIIGCLAPLFILLGGTGKTLIWLLDLFN